MQVAESVVSSTGRDSESMTRQWGTLNAAPVQLWAKPQGPQAAAAGVEQQWTCSLQQTSVGQVPDAAPDYMCCNQSKCSLRCHGVDNMLDATLVLVLAGQLCTAIVSDSMVWSAILRAISRQQMAETSIAHPKLRDVNQPISLGPNVDKSSIGHHADLHGQERLFQLADTRTDLERVDCSSNAVCDGASTETMLRQTG